MIRAGAWKFASTRGSHRWARGGSRSVPGSPSPKRYGGFYTQQQVRDIVAFAATRHVQIVPEIDMPGHAQAAIAAYPELGAIDSHPSLPVSAKWGVHTHLFNLEPAHF